MRHRMTEKASRRLDVLSDRNLLAVHLMFDMYLDFLMKQRVSSDISLNPHFNPRL